MKKIILIAASLLLISALLFADNPSGAANIEAVAKTSTSDEAGRGQIAISNPDYRVTPGDIYGLAFVVGSNTLEYKIVVDATYKIRVANLAVLDGSGKTFLTLKKQVEEIVSKNYPMSGVQFSLVTPAVFSVIVKGEVTSTYEYSAWALTRLSTVLGSHLTAYSSQRNITVTSSAGTVKNYDLYKAFRFGDMSQNPYLRPGDVITINKFDRKVSISGAVKRGGSYELKDGENLIQLIEYYGDGFKEQADLSRVEITRIVDAKDKTGQKIFLNLENMDKDYELKNYDSIYVDTLSDRMPVMFMEGAVMQSSSQHTGDADFVLAEGSTKVTVSFNLDENYGSFLRRRKSWFVSPVSDIKNAYIERGNQIIPIDISKILYDPDYYCDILVEPNDVLQIPFIQFFVSVAGSVYNPGRYPYLPNKTYEYYIGLAGGFITSQNAREAVSIKTVEGKKLSKKDIILPESTITAKTNSFLFYFNQYAPVITTILSIITSLFTIMIYAHGGSLIPYSSL